MQVTTASLTDPTVSETLCANQKLDLDAKIDRAVDKTLSMLRSAMTIASVGFSVGIAGMIGTPTMSRVLCDQIVFGCYGLPHQRSIETEQFLSKIVWSNLGPYLGMTFASLSRMSTSAASVGVSDSSLFSETSTVFEPEELEEDREDIQKLEMIRATAFEHSAE